VVMIAPAWTAGGRATRGRYFTGGGAIAVRSDPPGYW
jgi:hypothetical protein